MKEIIKFFLRKLLSICLFDTLAFLYIFKKYPWSKNKVIFNQKVLWRKYHDRNYLYTRYSDKLLVRDYVSNKIGNSYLIPLIDVFESPMDMKNYFSPDYVIKANHGAGMNIIFHDNDDCYNDNELNSIISGWFYADYSNLYGEFHYSKIDKKVLVERSLCNAGSVPRDYKFHCFKQSDNSVMYVLQVVDGRFGNESRAYFLNQLEHSFSYHGESAISIPSQDIIALIEVVKLNAILLADFDYVRIDWYVVEGKPYFGEMTFTPGGGLSNEFGPELEKIMSDYWVLGSTW